MNNSVFILGASYLGPEGFGNDQRGLKKWREPLADNLCRGELDGLHWSLLSNSDPSRFMRMDLMCRLGFMAAELLDAPFDAMGESARARTAVCVESFSGCLDTDIQFVTTPRPSLFAYTLPSTVIGEICIRFRLKGPVLSLISPAADRAAILDEAIDLLQTGQANHVLCFAIEAINRKTEEAIALPDFLRSQGWHAGAMLLGCDGNSPRAKILEPGTLAPICRRLCQSAPNTP